MQVSWTQTKLVANQFFARWNTKFHFDLSEQLSVTWEAYVRTNKNWKPELGRYSTYLYQALLTASNRFKSKDSIYEDAQHRKRRQAWELQNSDRPRKVRPVKYPGDKVVMPDIVSQELPVLDRLIAEEEREQLHKAIDKLRPKLRKVLDWQLAGTSNIVIASMLNCTRCRVWQLQREIVTELRDMIATEEGQLSWTMD